MKKFSSECIIRELHFMLTINLIANLCKNNSNFIHLKIILNLRHLTSIMKWINKITYIVCNVEIKLIRQQRSVQSSSTYLCCKKSNVKTFKKWVINFLQTFTLLSESRYFPCLQFIRQTDFHNQLFNIFNFIDMLIGFNFKRYFC